MEWNDSIGWVIFGLIGQAAFFSRFLTQWWVSERRGKSTVPTIFWYLSLLGSAALLIYALHRQEPIFALGQSVGGIVYVRNLILIRREQVAERAT